MFIIHGRRRLKTKFYTDYQQRCKSCQEFDMGVRIYHEYYHVFFIPFFPTGIKLSTLHCNSCFVPERVDSLQAQYERKTRAPFYLYTGPTLFGCLFLFMIFANLTTQKEKRIFVQHPMPGDVYTMREDKGDTTAYYFLRISRMNGDSVFALHNNLVYYGYVSQFNSEDFFIKDEELFFTKNQLMEMLDQGGINAVNRNYGASEGFNRLQ